MTDAFHARMKSDPAPKKNAKTMQKRNTLKLLVMTEKKEFHPSSQSMIFPLRLALMVLIVSS